MQHQWDDVRVLSNVIIIKWLTHVRMPETRLLKHCQVMKFNAKEITLLYLEDAQYSTYTSPETNFVNL